MSTFINKVAQITLLKNGGRCTKNVVKKLLQNKTSSTKLSENRKFFMLLRGIEIE